MGRGEARVAALIEVELRRCFIAAAIHAYPNRVRLYVRNVGVFKLEGGRFFHAGIKGQADVWGYFRGLDGITRPIEIEIKRNRRELDEAQDMWRTHCLEWGISYLQLTEEKNETDTVARFVRELGDVIDGQKAQQV